MADPIANPKAMKASQVLGRFSECYRRLEEAGLTFADLQYPIDDPEFRDRLVEFWRSYGGKQKIDKAGSTPAFSRDMRKEGWTLIENVSRKITSITDLMLIPILKNGENSINGEEMVRRARTELNANLDQEDAEWLLEHQAEIPKEWRKFYISLPGTVWQDLDGFRRVPCLDWRGGEWCLSFYWLALGWGSDGRLLSVGKS